jgi:hypothetical protein
MPDDLATSDPEYFKSPTFKIEQVGEASSVLIFSIVTVVCYLVHSENKKINLFEK